MHLSQNHRSNRPAPLEGAWTTRLLSRDRHANGAGPMTPLRPASAGARHPRVAVSAVARLYQGQARLDCLLRPATPVGWLREETRVGRRGVWTHLSPTYRSSRPAPLGGAWTTRLLSRDRHANGAGTMTPLRPVSARARHPRVAVSDVARLFEG